MGMSSRRRQEERHAGTSLKPAKLHTGARLAVQMIPAFSAVDAMILLIILGIWCTSACHWAIVDVAIVGTVRHGDFLYIARYIQHTMKDHRLRVKERPSSSQLSSSKPYE
jgi:hypothetical protein